MSDSHYDIAQICMNGHVINTLLRRSPTIQQKHCSECGALTITACPECNALIKGSYYTPGLITNYRVMYTTPSFCHDCGASYPWMNSKLKAARDLADEFENLTPEDRDLLKRSLDDIVRDTPQTTVSAVRFKRLAAKAGSVAASALKDILVDIASETAKKVIWPT